MLTHPQTAPLGNRPTFGRTSLAGGQDKIVLARQGDRWFQVIEGYRRPVIRPNHTIQGLHQCLVGRYWG